MTHSKIDELLCKYSSLEHVPDECIVQIYVEKKMSKENISTFLSQRGESKDDFDMTYIDSEMIIPSMHVGNIGWKTTAKEALRNNYDYVANYHETIISRGKEISDLQMRGIGLTRKTD